MKKLAIINATINMFCILRLVKKLHGDEIPQHMRERAKEEKEKSGHNFMVSFYAIPAITGEMLVAAEINAKLLKDAKVSATMVSQESVLKVFGFEGVDKVYASTAFLTKYIKRRKKTNNKNFEDIPF